MQAAVFRALGKPLEIAEVPDPKPGPCDLVLRVKSCGICGSDLHAASLPPGLPAGSVMGHEFAGEIVELGREAAAHFKIGERVCALPFIGCGRCRRLPRGRRHPLPADRDHRPRRSAGRLRRVRAGGRRRDAASARIRELPRGRARRAAVGGAACGARGAPRARRERAGDRRRADRPGGRLMGTFLRRAHRDGEREGAGPACARRRVWRDPCDRWLARARRVRLRDRRRRPARGDLRVRRRPRHAPAVHPAGAAARPHHRRWASACSPTRSSPCSRS